MGVETRVLDGDDGLPHDRWNGLAVDHSAVLLAAQGRDDTAVRGEDGGNLGQRWRDQLGGQAQVMVGRCLGEQADRADHGQEQQREADARGGDDQPDPAEPAPLAPPATTVAAAIAAGHHVAVIGCGRAGVHACRRLPVSADGSGAGGTGRARQAAVVRQAVVRSVGTRRDSGGIRCATLRSCAERGVSLHGGNVTFHDSVSFGPRGDSDRPPWRSCTRRACPLPHGATLCPAPSCCTRSSQPDVNGRLAVPRRCACACAAAWTSPRPARPAGKVPHIRIVLTVLRATAFHTVVPWPRDHCMPAHCVPAWRRTILTISVISAGRPGER